MANEKNEGSAGTGFDADYVKKLREEAAQWRTKCRDLEAQVAYTQIDSELSKRGIKADPRWVEIEEGQSVSDAVDILVEKHPHLAFKQSETKVQNDTPTTTHTFRPTQPKPLTGSQTNTVAPGQSAQGLLKDKNFTEIKKDPVARAKLRDLYRNLISEGSNRGSSSE